jgi:hypothetical protein
LRRLKVRIWMVLESAMSEVLKFGTNASSYTSRTIKGINHHIRQWTTMKGKVYG